MKLEKYIQQNLKISKIDDENIVCTVRFPLPIKRKIIEITKNPPKGYTIMDKECDIDYSKEGKIVFEKVKAGLRIQSKEVTDTSKLLYSFIQKCIDSEKFVRNISAINDNDENDIIDIGTKTFYLDPEFFEIGLELCKYNNAELRIR